MKAGDKSLFWELMNRTWYDWLALVVLIAVAAWLLLKLKARFQDREDLDACEQGMLSRLGDLRSQGDLTDEEYRSIKGQLASRIEHTTRREGQGGA